MADTEKAAADEQAEPKHPRERLIEDAHDFFDLEPHVVAGALANQKGNEFTLTEVKKHVKDWLKTPAETDQVEEV